MADRRLQVFHTVARLLSFTKAAETLHMTQPAVTFQVRQLEEYFNTRLFDRTHNRISLTEAGERVYEYADRIFDLYADMENSVREMTGEIRGALTIGASTTIAEYMLPALLGDFGARFPEVTIHLRVSNSEGIVSMVENNTIDLGVVEAPVGNKNLVVEMCREDHLVAIVPPSHDLAELESVEIGRLIEYPFICREEGSGTREVINEYLETNSCDSALNISMELGSPEAVKGAVEAGMGVSVVSRATIQKELKLDTLRAINLEPKLERPFSFVHQKQKFRLRAMEELLDFARGYCEDHAEEQM
ncbi:MAG: LysR family transcriptional regulator [gamma proteobacterium symbiont of Ctena orbiculata]|uniref:LysR family transcriptional regulator n=1 Tax=Candidatus Thiodiazotropha taylori TaxID=2792791 RepID=A0A944MD54_9GAMM|nr:LysR family transcriptional regulator [Candidatus Thiodiazotropha taylori]PUB88109.1 MAG: LysR family transcriptional regulator [gamma proteobacterium symbiont of Ctena orbiculata]MBT2989723.1 LysR family transcriptional regulator [Candidatus Thiodiazotropha taylori]MBT2995937.1 LysR family transcriptional regulator [Candidatus Thiodiazotropha taylori]MBT2999253.1 LysR family transcriptional regulator [Candidatus Thiodiazotropha taylori]